MSGNLTRRGLLAAGVVTLAGCVEQRTGTRPTAIPTTVAPVQPPPPVPPYTAPASDPLPGMKTAAGRFVQSLATFEQAGPTFAAPTGFTGVPADLDRAAQPLAAPGHWSRGVIEFVQFGGLVPVTARATSGVCMVVLRQELQAQDGTTSTVSRTLDVRLRRTGTEWAVTRLSPVGKTVRRATGRSAVARSVLGDSRITLPDTARWDIATGSVSDDLLVVLTQLAQVTPLSVTVLKTGHPRLVVDGRLKPPVSGHFYGRAVDIFALDGIAVAQVSPAQLRALVAAAAGMPEVRQIGAPIGYDTDGVKRRVFSNLVHADHLHIAVGGAGAVEGTR